MSDVARMALRVILGLSKDEAVRLVASEALAALDVEPSNVRIVKSNAERQAGFRERRRNAEVTPSVTRGEGGSVSEIPRNGGDPTQEGEREREGRNEKVTPAVTPGVTPRPLARDGLGWLVPSWCDGMRKATGEPTWEPQNIAPVPKKQIARVLELKAPPEPADRCAWAHGAARDYVEANQGREFSTFGFCTWIGSGKPVRGQPIETQRAEGPAVKQARRQREAMLDEAEKHATGITPEAKARLKAAGLM